MNVLLFLHSPVAGLPELEERHLARLRAEAPAITWIACRDRDEFVARLGDCRAAATWTFRKEWLPAAPGLRLLATPAAGREWIEPRGGDGLEVVFGTFHGELMAETAVALMLAFARGVKDSLDRRGETWPRAEVAERMHSVRGARAAIVGFGHIGKWIGRLLSPFGVRIWGVNRTDLSRPAWFGPDDAVLPLDELDRLLPETDHLVLALPGGAETDRLIDDRRLALLRRGAYVYNLGRGNSLDLGALVGALRRGEVAGAGLDVYDREPLPADAPIRTCPNAILLPHVSAFAPNYLDLFFDELLPKLKEMQCTCT